MPPRSKQSQRQSEWLLCERCKCHIFTRDNDVHSEVCKDDQPFSYDLCDTENSTHHLRHCFISNSSAVTRLDGMPYKFVLYLLVIFFFISQTCHCQLSVVLQVTTVIYLDYILLVF